MFALIRVSFIHYDNPLLDTSKPLSYHIRNYLFKVFSNCSFIVSTPGNPVFL